MSRFLTPKNTTDASRGCFVRPNCGIFELSNDFNKWGSAQYRGRGFASRPPTNWRDVAFLPPRCREDMRRPLGQGLRLLGLVKRPIIDTGNARLVAADVI